MKKTIKTAMLSIALFALSLPAFALEVDYPAIAGQTPGDSLTQYVRYVFIFVVAAAGFMALMVLAVGAVEYMGSSGDASKMKNAKSKIASSSFGILILLASYIILYTINPNLTNFEEPTIAEMAQQEFPQTPISGVPTADLLTRIKILAEDTEEIPDIIYNSAKLLSNISNSCDCKNTKPMCACEETLKCPISPWYTGYAHMDKIYYMSEGNELKVGQIVSEGDIIGEVGNVGTDTGPHLHFGAGFKETTGSSGPSTIDIRSKITAPGGIKGSWPSGASPVPLPDNVSQQDVSYILKTLRSPLEYDQCVWYEIKNSVLHTGDEYWAQDWKCLSDNLTESARVYVMSGNPPNSDEVKSIVESIDKSKGGVMIKHFCPASTPTPAPSPISSNSSKQLNIKSLASIESLADIIDCPIGETICGDDGYQICCKGGEICKPYTYLDKIKNQYFQKGFCAPNDRQTVCIGPNSNADRCTDANLDQVACCKNNSGDRCITTKTGFGCCNASDSKIFGAPGFQICCKDKDGNAIEGEGEWGVIDIGTWNNPQCFDIKNKPPFDCANGKTLCGTLPGYQCCYDKNNESCIRIENTSDPAYDRAYCCLQNSKLCRETPKEPVCCANNNTCLSSTANENLCCDTSKNKVCNYYLWNTFMGSTCCSLETEEDPSHIWCLGDWLNPICFNAGEPDRKPDLPPPAEGCTRYLLSENSSSSSWEKSYYKYYDACCDFQWGEYSCFNYDYQNPGNTCCDPDQQCVVGSSGPNCSCRNDGLHKVCGSAKLRNQVCCKTDQICGGDQLQAKCLDPVPAITPTPIICPSGVVCASNSIAYNYKFPFPEIPDSSSYYLPTSEIQTCCSYGSACYIKDKNNNPLHSSDYELYNKYLPNSTGACCDLSNNNLHISGLYGACCPKNVDIAVNQYGVPSCCNYGEKACGASTTTDVEREPGKIGGKIGKTCCKSDEVCTSNNTCEKFEYCESPTPAPISGTYPKACSCSPTPTPSPSPSVNLKCTDQTCFGGEKYHPCGEEGFKELLHWQSEVISKKDVLVYYKNRLIAEKKDLKTDIEKYVKPTLEWFGREIKRRTELLSGNTATSKSMIQKQIEFLKERMSWLEEEQKYKEDLVKKMEDAEKTLDQFDYISANVSQLPDKCLTNVKSACNSVCTKENQVPHPLLFAGEDKKDIILDKNGNPMGNYGCHNAFWGCKPMYCEGGNPCPAKEISAEAEKLGDLSPNVKSAYDEIIYLILTIKKERIPKISF